MEGDDLPSATEASITTRPETGGRGAVRFVASADWQLGMRRRYLDPEAQGRFSQDRLEAVAAVGRLAREVGAAFVVVAGDVFDDNQVDRQTVLRALRVLAEFPPVPVLLLPANHDPLDPASVYTTPEFLEHRPEHVHVVSDAEPIRVADGVEVVGAPWRTKAHVENPVTAVIEGLRPHAGATRVLLAHGNLDTLVGEQQQAGLLRLDDLEAALDDARVDFVVLGDRHSTTDVGRSGRIWYPGAPEPTNYVERDPGNALVVDVGDDHVEVRPRRVGRWRFRQEVFELAGTADVDRVLRWLDDDGDAPRTVVKLGLRGVLPLRDRERLEAALDDAAQLYAALERWERHEDLVTAPDDDDLEAMDVSGFVADAVDELRAVVDSGGEDSRTAGDALSLLYRLVRR